MKKPVTRRISLKSFLKVFTALLDIDYANGAVNRYEPASTFYDIPEPWIASLAQFERELGTFSVEQLETICCGNQDEAEKLITPELHAFLNDYFNGWESQDEPKEPEAANAK